jgi:trimeric autotransporter adhesin
MSGVSPSSVLFSSDGTELAVTNNTTVVSAAQRAILFAAVNPNNKTDFLQMTLAGGLGTSSYSNNVSVQSAATVTTSGSFTTNVSTLFGTQEIALVVNVGTVTGAGSIQYTIQETDPGDNLTLYGSTASTAVISSGNAPGVFTAVLNVTTATSVTVTWTVTGTFSATIYSTITTKETASTQTVNGTVAVSSVGGTVAVTQSTSPWVVSGTVAVTQSTSPWVISGTVNQGTPNTLANAWPITLTDGYGNIQGSSANPIWIQGSISATNPSVGTDGATALGFDTQVGGKTTTAAPTYTTGNLDALSLTTLGGLRVDGVYAGGTSTATAADQMVSGGYVTTAAPTYTTGQLNALSLTTAGSLRVDGTGGVFNNQSVGADAATALAFDTQVGGKVTTAAPTYTTGNLDALSLTTVGGLRIDAHYPVGTTNANSPDMGVVGGYTTTLAPTYTNGQINPLSLDGYGNLRTVAITNKAATSAVTSVAQANTNTVLLSSNQNRIFASIYNNAGQKMYIKLGTTANTTNSYSIQLMPNSYWEVPQDYQGEIDAIWSGAGGGNALVTELSP